MKHKYASGSWRWAVLASREGTNIDWCTKYNVMDFLLEGKSAFYFHGFSVDLARIKLAKFS